MFNLKDSYITPIILSYVDKYIKNIRLEDTQVSLWSGEAVFHNLSLRLDVLEQELALPFSFVSGHIHELAITVPWTKLQSEPIKVTINTIECILKLKTETTANQETASTTSNVSREAKKKTKRQGEVESPPGYVQNLVNRIVSNITVECNNLILKYVEEDIVLSLNVRSVLLQSANEKWLPAFIELAVGQVTLRKLVSLHDLTVCLDRRNASGKIEFYEDPLLYRCSMELHLSRTFINSASNRALETRLDLNCSRMEFSVSDQQMPMFLRVLRLGMALYLGELKNQPGSNQNDGQDAGDDENESGSDGASGEQGGESWVGWAWSFVPSVLPLLDDDWEPENPPGLAEHTLRLGFYVRRAVLIFKATECHIERSYYGPKKVKFIPMGELRMQGCVMQSTMSGLRAVGVSMGVSQISVFPLGDHCPCGVPDIPTSEKTLYLSLGNKCNNYLKGSLFDPHFNHNSQKNDLLSWDDHLAIITEAYMLEKTPAIAIDYRYMLSVPEDFSAEQLSEIGSDLEFSNLPEQALCRFVVAPLQLNFCAGLLHRMQMIYQASIVYNYPPYYEPGPEPNRQDLAPPTEEDTTSLETNMPLRAYQLTMFKPTVHLYLIDHHSKLSDIQPGKKKKKVPKNIKAISLSSLPRFTIECQCLDATHVKPMYSRRLITTACQLSMPTEAMFTNCHLHSSIKLLGLGFNLKVNRQKMTVIVPSHLSIHRKRLVSPKYWLRTDLAHSDLSVHAESMTATANKAQILIIAQIITSLFSACNDRPLESSLFEDACSDKALPYLELSLEGFSWQHVISASSSTHRIVLKTARMFVLRAQNTQSTEQVLVLTGRENNLPSEGSDALFSLTLQYPICSTALPLPSIILVKLLEIDICLDPLLLDWMGYTPVIMSTTQQVSQSLLESVRHPRRTSGSLETKSRTPAPQESVHSSDAARGLERSPIVPLLAIMQPPLPKTEVPWWKATFLKWYTDWSCALACIEFASCTIYIPSSSPSSLGAESIRDTMARSVNADILVLKLPSITLHSCNQRQGLHVLMAKLPITLPPSLWRSDRQTFPWSLKINEMCCDTIIKHHKKTLLYPVSANCTIGISSKIENKALTLVGLCVHIDTPFMRVAMSIEQVVLVTNTMDRLTKLLVNAFMPKKENVAVVTQLEAQPSPTPPATITAPSVMQHPISAGSISEPPTPLLLEDLEDKDSTTEPSVRVTIWLQWTLARFLCSLYTMSLEQSAEPLLKLTCDLEDMMTSVDIQQVYLKLKSKVATASVQHYCRKSKTDCWKPGQHLGLILRCNDDTLARSTTPVPPSPTLGGLRQSSCGSPLPGSGPTARGLLDITFTRAQSRNVHKRWAQQLARHTSEEAAPIPLNRAPRYISEIVIKLCPMDLLLSAPVITNFLSLVEPFLKLGSYAPSHQSTPMGLQLNNNTLPLLYLDTKDIRVFLPITPPTTSYHDFCLAQVDAITLAPHVYNPLSRVYVRPDIYHMAQQANILSVPGAEVEDRQYQLDIRKLCIQTGAWNELEKCLQKENQLSDQKPLSENPAVEWNKLAQGKDTLYQAEVSLLPLVHRFDVSIMAAPAIVYQQIGLPGEPMRNLLVCGHSAEVNALSDIELSANINQLNLASNLAVEWLKLVAFSTKMLKKVSRVLENVPPLADSGIDDLSSICSPPIRKFSKSRQPEFVPSEILITASKVSLTLYDINRISNKTSIPDIKPEKRFQRWRKRVDKQISPDMFEEILSDPGYEASEDSSVEGLTQNHFLVNPLVCIRISQPHGVLACHSLKQRVEVSCFDLVIQTSNQSYILRNGNTCKQIPRNDKFLVSILETRSGDPHPKTGIPPSFLTVTWSNFLSNCGKLRVELGRPVRLYCGTEALQCMQEIQSCLKNCLLPLNLSSRQSVKISPKEEMLLSQLWEIPALAFSAQQLLVMFDFVSSEKNKNKLALSLASISGSLSSRTSAWKGIGTVKAQLEAKSIMVQLTHEGRNRSLIHPWSFKSEATLAWEPWLLNPDLPLIQTSIECDCITIDIGPDHIKCLAAIWKELYPLYEHFQMKKETTDSIIAPPRPTLPQDEHYRDDLRAGAFQFVDNGSTTDLPLPYQVLFCHQPPSMAWRYPQPRAITRADIFPVPFISAGHPKQEGDSMSCILQYWSESQSIYITYCKFKLSESKMCRLTLPAPGDMRRTVMASTWRVQLDPHSDDDDEERGIRRVSVPPRALAACMRIDSYFSSNLVPQIQASLTIATVQLNLHCQLSNLLANLPPPLSNFTYDGLIPESLPFLSFIFDSTSAQLCKWSNGTILTEMEAHSRCEAIDLLDITKLTLVEPFRSQLKVYLANDPGEQPTIELTMTSKPICIWFGPAAGHSLATATHLWNKAMQPNAQDLGIVVTRYVICNDLNESIQIRQIDTSEKIVLASRHCHMYAWQSICKKQLLQISLLDGGLVWSNGLNINEDGSGLFYFEGSQRQVGIVWKVRALSTTQKMITVSGQLLVTNLLQESLDVQLLSLEEEGTSQTDTYQSRESFVVKSQSTPASLLLDKDKKFAIKVRFQPLSGTWSGEIPLAMRSGVSLPWLVKVPLQEKGQFLSVWCRIFIQNLSNGSKTLAILSPMYAVRSLMPVEMRLGVSTPGLQVHMETTIEGRGNEQQLYCPGTIEHSHSITFLSEEGQSTMEVPTVPLSYTMSQQPTKLALSGKGVDVDDICSQLLKPTSRVWPYVGNEHSLVKWAQSVQPPTQAKVSYELPGPHFSTLLLQLRPWALLVNLLDLKLLLSCMEWSEPYLIPSMGTVIPPEIEGTFHLGLSLAGKPYYSSTLQLAGEDWNVSFYMPRISGVVPLTGHVQTTINTGSGQICYLTLTSEILAKENDMRILSVRPTVILTSMLLDITLEVVGVTVIAGTKHHPLPLRSSMPTILVHGKSGSLLHWTCPMTTSDGELIPYVMFSMKGNPFWSCPIQIPMPGTLEGCASRQSFAIGDVGLVLTTHFRAGQVFAVVNRENHPQLRIINKCRFPLLCAQMESGQESKPTTAVLDCEHFAWRCFVPPGSKTFYTMPIVTQRFPELASGTSLPPLVLAIPEEERNYFTEEPAWSEGLSINGQSCSEQFIRLPRQGDVRIQVHSASGVTHVQIETISRIEISAKEIRARLQPGSQLLPYSAEYKDEETEETLPSELKPNPLMASHSVFITAHFLSIQLTVISNRNQQPTEILLLSLDDICLNARSIPEGREISVCVCDLQLDNQMYHNGGFDFPVVVVRQEPLTHNLLDGCAFEQLIERARKCALININIIQEVGHDDLLAAVKSINISIKPISLYLEDTFLIQLSKTIQGLALSSLIFLPENPRAIDVSVDVAWEADQTSNPVQVRSLMIEPLSVMVSLHTSLKVFIALDRSPLSFSAFERHQVLTTSYRLGHSFTRHYLSGAIFRAGWVVGSLELLGSPGGFALTVGSGLRDFVCLPYLGILQGPWGFVVGVTHGSASLMKHVTAGTLSSLTNLASSVARNLDRCSLDQEHVERVEEARRQRPQGVGQGFIQGLSSLGISLLGAVSGIAHHPLQALVHQNSSPITGVMAGVGLGLVGALTKPLSGAAELVALTGQGLLHGAGWSSMPQTRRRPLTDLCASRTNSTLKYTWKVLPLSERPLLMATEVTAINFTGQFEAATLLLSPQLFTVYSMEQDEQRNATPVSHLQSIQTTTDPTLLAFCMDQFNSLNDGQGSSQARIEDYVRHTGLAFLTLEEPNDDLFSLSSASLVSSPVDSSHGMLTFHINPQVRDHFLAMFTLTQRQALGKGFPVI